MGLISGFTGALRAVMTMFLEELADREESLAQEHATLAIEIDMLRDAMATQREALERQRLEVRDVLARYGARKGETFALFVARIADERHVALESLQAERRRGMARRRDDAAHIDRLCRVIDKTTHALRPVATEHLFGLVAMAESTAAMVHRLRAQVQQDAVNEWERAATTPLVRGGIDD